MKRLGDPLYGLGKRQKQDQTLKAEILHFLQSVHNENIGSFVSETSAEMTGMEEGEELTLQELIPL